MKIRICLLALCVAALVSSTAGAWGPPPRPGFYFGVYGPPVYGPPVYGPGVYGPPVYAPPVVMAPPPPRVYVGPGPAYIAPGPPGYYYPRPAVGATFWIR